MAEARALLRDFVITGLSVVVLTGCYTSALSSIAEKAEGLDGGGSDLSSLDSGGLDSGGSDLGGLDSDSGTAADSGGLDSGTPDSNIIRGPSPFTCSQSDEPGCDLQVPAGPFWMGCIPGGVLCDADRNLNESPYHEVTLSEFFIDKYEVTVGAYAACVAVGACSETGTFDRDCNAMVIGSRDQHPMNCVSWNQAMSYCAWAQKRLPTEAEWEKAARESNSWIYSWGNETPTCQRAVMDDGGRGCGTGGTLPVGSKLDGASPCGALDMIGNIGEWVFDWYDEWYYRNSPASDPQGPAEGTARLDRGGSWYDFNTEYLRVSYRRREAPGTQSIYTGFRCARSGS